MESRIVRAVDRLVAARPLDKPPQLGDLLVGIRWMVPNSGISLEDLTRLIRARAAEIGLKLKD